MFATSLAVLLLSGRASLKEELQGRYNMWSKAYVALDAAKLEAMLAPGYELVDSRNQTTKREDYVAYLRTRAKLPPDGIKTSTLVRSVRVVSAEEAEAIAVETMESLAVNPKTALPERCLHRHEYLDQWNRMGGQWLLSRTVTRRESTEYRR